MLLVPRQLESANMTRHKVVGLKRFPTKRHARLRWFDLKYGLQSTVFPPVIDVVAMKKTCWSAPTANHCNRQHDASDLRDGYSATHLQQYHILSRPVITSGS